MQALELEAALLARHFQYEGRGVRIVGGELGIKPIACGPDLLRAGEIGDIGGYLAGEDRIPVEALLLRMLDLGVPVSAFDQAHRNTAAVTARELDQPRHHVDGAFLVGLHDHAQAIPFASAHGFIDRLDNIEHQVEAVSFFGIEGDTDAGVAREHAQRLHPWHQLGQYALALGVLEARVQCRQLDRDARRRVHVRAVAGFGR